MKILFLGPFVFLDDGVEIVIPFLPAFVRRPIEFSFRLNEEDIGYLDPFVLFVFSST